MRLSTKISLAAVSFLFLFSQIFSLWLLGDMRTGMVEVIRQQEWDRLEERRRNLVHDWQDRVL